MTGLSARRVETCILRAKLTIHTKNDCKYYVFKLVPKIIFSFYPAISQYCHISKSKLFNHRIGYSNKLLNQRVVVSTLT